MELRKPKVSSEIFYLNEGSHLPVFYFASIGSDKEELEVVTQVTMHKELKDDYFYTDYYCFSFSGTKLEISQHYDYQYVRYKDDKFAPPFVLHASTGLETKFNAVYCNLVFSLDKTE